MGYTAPVTSVTVCDMYYDVSSTSVWMECLIYTCVDMQRTRTLVHVYIVMFVTHMLQAYMISSVCVCGGGGGGGGDTGSMSYLRLSIARGQCHIATRGQGHTTRGSHAQWGTCWPGY